MRTSKRLTLLTLVVSTTALVIGVATPSMADELERRPAVVTNIAAQASVEQIRAQAQDVSSERLPGRASSLSLVDSSQRLTVEQIDAVASGRDADGLRRLGDVRDPSPTTTLQDMARQIGVGDVVWWECIVIIWGDWEIWICRPLVLRA